MSGIKYNPVNVSFFHSIPIDVIIIAFELYHEKNHYHCYINHPVYNIQGDPCNSDEWVQLSIIVQKKRKIIGFYLVPQIACLTDKTVKDF